ncbi:hypothetical protein WA158_003205 [Blastocystis sp. Blastoise]
MYDFLKEGLECVKYCGNGEEHLSKIYIVDKNNSKAICWDRKPGLFKSNKAYINISDIVTIINAGVLKVAIKTEKRKVVFSFMSIENKEDIINVLNYLKSSLL